MKEFENYINKRLLELEDLEKRKEIRKILDENLIQIYKRKNSLEEKLKEKIKINSEKTNDSIWILNGLAKRNTYEHVCNNMYPVFDEDLKEFILETENVLMCLEKGNSIKVDTFFLEATFEIVEELKKRKSPFKGVIHTRNSDYRVEVQIRYSEKYEKRISSLKKHFENNGYEWRTPCAIYCHKMFEILLIETDIPWYEEIISMDIDYEEYGPYMKIGWIPVWNMEQVNLVTDLRPQSLEETVLHQINPKRLEKDKQYLVVDIDCSDISCVRENGIKIYCNEKNPKIWKGYKVHREGKTDMTYEILSNKETDIHVFPSRTLGGIQRLFQSLNYLERFLLMDVEIEEMQEVIKVVILVKNLKNDFIQDDVRNYLKMEMQRQYPEYQICIEVC